MHKSIAIATIGLTLLGSCASKTDNKAEGDNKPLLMVSIEPQRQILEQLVGPNYEVRSLLGRGSNPETFDPSTKERLAADNAEIYFGTGVLPFEETLEESLKTTYVNTNDGVELIYGTHSHNHGHHHGHHHGHTGDHHDHNANECEHNHEAPDPHYWSSVSGARAIASNMASALIKSMPDSATIITERLDALMAHYSVLESTLDSITAPAHGSTFAIWHPSLSYFARDYNLKQLTLGVEGKELSVKGLRDAIDKAKDAKVRIFFFQREYDSRQAEPLNDGIGSKLVTINPMDYDWENQLILVANEIARP